MYIKVYISHLDLLICYYLPEDGNLLPENTEGKKSLAAFKPGYNFDLKKEQDRYERAY